MPHRSACGSPGLLTEEFDVIERQLRGNIPQAFVHALVLECDAAQAQVPGPGGSGAAGAGLAGTGEDAGRLSGGRSPSVPAAPADGGVHAANQEAEQPQH
jgi:hypothetical protein